jgi:hypothetical protein
MGVVGERIVRADQRFRERPAADHCRGACRAYCSARRRIAERNEWLLCVVQGEAQSVADLPANQERFEAT